MVIGCAHAVAGPRLDHDTRTRGNAQLVHHVVVIRARCAHNLNLVRKPGGRLQIGPVFINVIIVLVAAKHRPVRIRARKLQIQAEYELLLSLAAWKPYCVCAAYVLENSTSGSPP